MAIALDRDGAISVQAGNARLHAQRRGAGPWTVFVHGFGGDLHSWDGLWQALDQDRALLRYDLRGHGKSTETRGAPFDHAEDLEALLDGLGIEKCDLIGISMGGAIALNFAIDRPARVRKLVLISPGMVGWDWSDEWRALMRPITALARGGDLGGARRLWWQHPLFRTVRETPAGPALLASIKRFSGYPWIADDHRPMMPDVERLHRIAMPVLLLTGGEDMPDFRLKADLIAAASPLVRRVDLPGHGHMLHLENPEWTAGEVGAFLDE